MTLAVSETVRALGNRSEEMIRALAEITETEGQITRLFLSPEHKRAAALVSDWMEQAGLTVSNDAIGTVCGILPANNRSSSNKTLLIGSHIDTVINAGAYDGPFGVVAGVLAVSEIQKRGIELPFAVEVLAFGDEEGVRFPSTLLSSSAVAGVAKPEDLEVTDADGVRLCDALKDFGGDPAATAKAARDPDSVLGYLEVHIEQGPVLEAERLSVGIVTSIAGANRYRVTLSGMAGHAGTVPMHLRSDALVGAAELICAINQIAHEANDHGVVATVGELSVEPGAVNVIPAEVVLSLDLRAATDEPRHEAARAIKQAADKIAAKHGLSVGFEQYHEVSTCLCADRFQNTAEKAIKSLGLRPLRLMSGAGHDGQAMSQLTDIGMMFVRCQGGISHNPLEYVEPHDMGLAVEALVRWIETIAEEERAKS
ncbi:allantoate amidohydrolase [Pseudovibrio exalbescens]|uniref:allantoate amidohydrolase n=1 Tax=Pseudovibrio exalbescens TaxID=197461 RepID=UPI0023663702|nr:allantoate amidohydrolase [Pseudovibrio exalbescens]MDD7908810.1 allantoate amidohydrolase [Pseudovibrio exalbescens]